jgi:tetratricopeptide (TPR) repeat protein
MSVFPRMPVAALLAACVLAGARGEMSPGDVIEDVAGVLDQGLPTVALARLGRLDESRCSAGDFRRIAVLRARALLARQDAGGALAALLPWEGADTGVDFWLAEALAASGDFARALGLYEACEDDSVFGPDARVGAARMLAALGRHGVAVGHLEGVDPAVAALERAAILIDAGDADRAIQVLDASTAPPAKAAYLRARALVAVGEGAKAALLLEDVDPAVAPRPALLAARLAFLNGKPGDAEEILEAWIEVHPRHPLLPEAFDLLDRVYALNPNTTATDLRRWTGDASHPARAEAALLITARNDLRAGRMDRAAAAYRDLLEMPAGDALAQTARIELAGVWMAAGRLQDAWGVLGGASGPGADFARGLVKAAEGDHAAAAEFFASARRGPMSAEAAYNHALCRILDGAGVDVSDPLLTPADAAALRHAAALHLASSNSPDAATSLEKLATAPGAAPRDVLALAEWEYLGGRAATAHDRIRTISNADPETTQRAAAFSVFLEDRGQPDGEVRAMAAARAFLEAHPDAPMAPAVNLKLAEILFRRGDYLSARRQFDAVAANPEAGPLADKARFLAAQSAARSMDPAGLEEAVEIYDDLARGGGPLAARARLAQAMLLNALERPGEAVTVLEALLASNPDDAVRLAALIEKGDTHFAGGTDNPAAYREAIATWRLAAEPDSPPRWRNQALVKIAAASERLGEFPAALAGYHDVLSAPQTGDPEYFWYFKAGFDAARLLESDGRLEEAAAIYAKLAAKGGPRSQEAAQRLSRLKLENFLWEEEFPPGASQTANPP